MIEEAVMEEYRTTFDTEISPALERLSQLRMGYFRKVTQDTRLSGADRVLLCTHSDAVILYSLLAFDASSPENATKYMNAVASTVLELIEERD
ncbi:MAG TPA: hypothetical protein VGW35_22965 [Methylomirabilota bacterium]|jgi:hypothetical protein|nr:hypothetical protein [Methylomirabilota bacterium]